MCGNSKGKESLLHILKNEHLNGSGNYKSVYFISPLAQMASLVAQMVKNLPAMQETWLRSLGWEDHLEKEMATHSSIPA